MRRGSSLRCFWQWWQVRIYFFIFQKRWRFCRLSWRWRLSWRCFCLDSGTGSWVLVSSLEGVQQALLLFLLSLINKHRLYFHRISIVIRNRTKSLSISYDYSISQPHLLDQLRSYVSIWAQKSTSVSKRDALE